MRSVKQTGQLVNAPFDSGPPNLAMLRRAIAAEPYPGLATGRGHLIGEDAMKYYKVLDGNKSCNGGSYTWSLPVKNDDGSWTPGEWTTPVEGAIEECENGYHLCRAEDLIYWIGRDIYEVEPGPEMIKAEQKVVARTCRLLRKVETWNERTARLFAVWCAREALKLIENPDPRSMAACDVAERYANGLATAEELAAAMAAARDAAMAAARDAASDAAWAAARDAASDAAWDAASDAAWAAARDAASDAAWDAARDAASDAAWDAQNAHLLEMLGEA